LAELGGWAGGGQGPSSGHEDAVQNVLRLALVKALV
jgi:hypothetical protein